jgi:hypothetical protein
MSSINLIDVFQGYSVYFLLFAAYLELSPKIGNVWYRMGVNGYREIRLSGLINIILKPLSMIELWYPANWDINYFIGGAFTSMIIYWVKIYIKKI